MPKVTVSPKYQIVIPKGIRKALKIRPGQKIEMVQIEDRLELIPLRPMKQFRGVARGIDTTVVRERDRL